MPETNADGSAYNALKDFAPAPSEADVTDIRQTLSPGNLLEGVEFNAPLPNTLRRGWVHHPDEYSRQQALEVLAPVGKPGLANQPGFIVLDPHVEKTVRKGQNDQAQNAAQPVDDGAGGKWMALTKSWGFRFHFNPSSFTESYSKPMNVNYMALIQAVISLNRPPASMNMGAAFSLDLLLSRHEDMILLRGKDKTNQQKFYTPALTDAQADDIRERGTIHDLEYLFRVFNMDPIDTWRGETAEWGMLLPSAVIVSLGNSPGARKVRAVVRGIGIAHRQFTADMVPVYTDLSLQMQRIPDFYYTETPTESRTSSTTGTGGNTPVNTAGLGAVGQIHNVIDLAMSLQGKFRYNGSMQNSSPENGMDCSGFTWYVYKNAAPGSVPDQYGYTGVQAGWGKEVTGGVANARAGDLFLYGSPPGYNHVALYLGNNRVIHSSSPGPEKDEAKVVDYNQAYHGQEPTMIRRILEG